MITKVLIKERRYILKKFVVLYGFFTSLSFRRERRHRDKAVVIETRKIHRMILESLSMKAPYEWFLRSRVGCLGTKGVQNAA